MANFDITLKEDFTQFTQLSASLSLSQSYSEKNQIGIVTAIAPIASSSFGSNQNIAKTAVSITSSINMVPSIASNVRTIVVGQLYPNYASR